MTSSLYDLAQDVRSGVERLSQKDDLIDEVRRLRAIDNSLSAMVEQSGDVMEMLGVARSQSLPLPMPNVESARAAVAQLIDQAGHGDLDAEYAAAADQSIRGLLEELRNSLLLAWRDYVSTRVPAQEGLLLLADALSDVEGVGVSANRLHASLMVAQSLFNQRPSYEAVAKLDALSSEIPELVQALVGDDAEVRAFAEQLAAGGAGLETLTASVQSWIDERGIRGSFKIVPGRPGEVDSQ
jgi:hypothetical protein